MDIKANPGERYAFRRIKSDAAAARREFTITLQWFIGVCHQPCHYCGRIDINKLSVKSRGAKAGFIVENFRYNGIDRIDNSVGYIPENCVPCCVVCNRGKNSMGLEEWNEYLDTIVEFRTGRRDEVPHLRIPVEGRVNQAREDSITINISQGNLREDGTPKWSLVINPFIEGRGAEFLSIKNSGSVQEEEPNKE